MHDVRVRGCDVNIISSAITDTTILLLKKYEYSFDKNIYVYHIFCKTFCIKAVTFNIILLSFLFIDKEIDRA
jgi:hypothetical protein